jgi:hypothetical protein
MTFVMLQNVISSCELNLLAHSQTFPLHEPTSDQPPQFPHRKRDIIRHLLSSQFDNLLLICTHCSQKPDYRPTLAWELVCPPLLHLCTARHLANLKRAKCAQTILRYPITLSAMSDVAQDWPLGAFNFETLRGRPVRGPIPKPGLA